MSLTRLPGFTLDNTSNVTFANADVTGNLTSGNANLGNAVTANFFIGSGNNLSNIQAANITGTINLANFATTANSVAGANVSGFVANANIANTAYAVAGANVSGEVSFAATANAVAGANVSGFVANANIANTAYSVAGANVSGAVAYATTANSVAGANVSGAVAYATTANSVAGANVSGQVGNASLAGTVTTNAQPNITSVGTLSSLSVTGDIGAANLTLTGNLIVSGSTTSVNSTVTRIVDPLFELGGGANGAALSADDNKDRGLLLHYYSGASPVDAFMGWDDSNAEFAFGSNVTVASEVTTFNSLGNIRANFLLGNGYYLTGIDQLAAGSADVANSIANGTSNINTPTSGGNITVGIGGTANTVVFTSTGINVAANVSANILISRVAQGTSPLNITSNTKVTNLNADLLDGYDTSTANTANTVAVRTSTGNLSANFFTGNGYYLTGIDQLAAGSADVANSIANGTSNINTPTSGGNITVGIGGSANRVVFTSTGVNIAGYANLGSGNLTTTGNVTANVYFGNGSQLTGVGAVSAGYIANGTSNVNIPAINGNVTISVAGIGNIVTITNTGVNVAGHVTATGNLSAGSNYVLGNGYYLTGIDTAGRVVNGTSNLSITTVNGNITMGVAGNSNVIIVTGTGVNIAGYANITGNAVIGGNITSIDANLGNAVTANYFIGNLFGNANIAGTVTTNAQPNITSVGTLTGLVVGNASANTIFGNGSITAAGNISFTGPSVSLGSIGNISITGGAANYFLKTDGAGSLSWATPSGGVGGTSLTYTPDTAPPVSGNVLGDQWFNTTTNVLYEYINDGTGSYWVDVSSPSITTNTGIAGAVIIKDEGSNLTTAVASIDFVGGGVTATNTGNAVTVTIPTAVTRAQVMGYNLVFGG